LGLLMLRLTHYLIYFTYSLLKVEQEIFPTQESKQGLLHCRWILYQLCYQESSDCAIGSFKNVILTFVLQDKLFERKEL